jgi:hypothetical protein
MMFLPLLEAAEAIKFVVLSWTATYTCVIPARKPFEARRRFHLTRVLRDSHIFVVGFEDVDQAVPRTPDEAIAFSSTAVLQYIPQFLH